MVIRSINPANEEVIATFEEMTPNQVEQTLESAAKAAKGWARASFEERAGMLHRVAKVLRQGKSEFARLMTLEMGKPITEAEGEVEKSAWACDFYADNAKDYLAPERVHTNATDSYVAYEPLGLVLGIMPWNFPFWQVFRFAAPTLMAGNTIVLKHASNVTQCSLAIERIFREGGLPEGVFRVLLVPGSEVPAIIADPRIHAVSLTGSSETGSRVAEAAGRALKKSLLELGGSDPFIVLADADLGAAAATGTRGRFINTGQSCIADKRFVVVKDVLEEFQAKLVAEVSKLKVGDPLDHTTQIGPLARADLRDALDDQVKRSVQQGAKLLVGGSKLEGPGYFYAPTVLAGVTSEMAAACEETFGPVAAILEVNDIESAIEVANNTEYGLGAGLWTRDIDKARELARRIESGAVFINGLVASDPRLPFGGVKHSGYGRELSIFGIREFVNVQCVWIGPALGPQMVPPKP